MSAPSPDVQQVLGRSSGGVRLGVLAVAAVTALASAGCSIRALAINALARSLTASGDVFASDEDPELIRDATPFALKTMEALLAEKPDHPGLLLGACRGFTQYAYAFVEIEAEQLEETDYDAAERGLERALALYLRARDYCLRALDNRSPGIRRRLETEAEAALVSLRAEDLPLLYWTGASWGAAISIALDRPEITADLPAVQALFGRVAALDDSWGQGAVHEALMLLATLPETMGGSAERAREHFRKAVEMSRGLRASTYVGLAGSLSIQEQDREEFVELLHKALEVDPDGDPSGRLANVIAQRRARWLLERVEEYFL